MDPVESRGPYTFADVGRAGRARRAREVRRDRSVAGSRRAAGTLAHSPGRPASPRVAHHQRRRASGSLRGGRARAAGDLPSRMGSATQLPTARRSVPWPTPAAVCTRPRFPGSVGPPSSTPKDRSFAGYGRWVGRFLDAVGEETVALVAGHSFGGGVATAFTHDATGPGGLPPAGQRGREPHLGSLPERGPHDGAAPVLGLDPPLHRRPALDAATVPPAPDLARGLRR